jgi:RNA polymerase sigma factor (sigma-70 family)
MSPSPPCTSRSHTPGFFAATRWTMVLSAVGQGNRTGSRALAELCQCYWRPLYAYLRWQGFNVEEAEDLTQEFFARLLDHNGLATVDPGKGKFRSFLLASLKHFLANERDRARALKRGGGLPPIPLDALSAEKRRQIEPTDDLSPDKAFERQWALTVLDQALSRLRTEFSMAGKEALFEELKGFLTGDGRADAHTAVGGRCGMSEGAVKVAVHRLRRRYRDLLREEIAQTVGNPEEVDDEIRNLFASFR